MIWNVYIIVDYLIIRGIRLKNMLQGDDKPLLFWPRKYVMSHFTPFFPFTY